jgi:predicted NACHT family NTPase
LRRLSEVELKVVQSNDQILKRIADLEIKIQSNPMEDRLKDVEERMKTNEELMERLQNLERKVDKMLAVNEEPMKVF